MELPERCDAAEIEAVLVAAAQPESRLILDRPMDVAAPAVVSLTTQKLWRVTLWRMPGAGLTSTLAAWSPDGRDWQLGCQRRWTGDGSSIDPLAALSTEQREALDQRLQRAVCWPQIDEALALVPDLAKVARKSRPAARRRVKEVVG